MKKYYFLISFCLMSSIGIHAQLVCNGTDIFQTLPITTNTQLAAYGTLTATNEITGSAVVIYQAEDYILLQGGYFVNEEASLLAKTEGCPVNNHNIEGFQMTILNNPTASTSTVEFRLENKIELEIMLLNLLGQKVKTIQSPEPLISGLHTLIIDLSSMAQGSYFLVFQTPKGQMNIFKLIKI